MDDKTKVYSDLIMSLSDRVNYLEDLLAKNCDDANISFFDFTDNVESGWDEYLYRFEGRISSTRESRRFITSYDHGV
jgi:hypothetical protein